MTLNKISKNLKIKKHAKRNIKINIEVISIYNQLFGSDKFRVL